MIGGSVQMAKFNFEGMGRDELTDLLAEVMTQLRKIEVEDIKSDFITRSQKLRTEMNARQVNTLSDRPGWFTKLEKN